MNQFTEALVFTAPEPAALAPFFPGYLIRHLIATGGMGAVYLAVQKSVDRNVALKILPRELTGNREFRAQFEAEARAMARLNHPNLLSLYDFGETHGMLYITMEYVHGKSLFHSSRGAMIDPREVVRITTGICEGLAHAHENGVLHRDIKPSNILLTPRAEPKIGDFGLARRVGHKGSHGETIYGTPGYTAPEVLATPDKADLRADLFSVGVILHELLTGKLPSADPRPPSAICGCPARLDAIIRRATDPSPGKRYPNATALARDLKQAIPAKRAARELPSHVAPRQPDRPTRIRRRPLAPFLALAVAVTAVVAGAASYFGPGSVPPRAVSDSLPRPAAAAPPVAAAPPPSPVKKPSAAAIPAEARPFNGKFYLAYWEKLTWSRARQKCEDLGGQLAVIHDPASQEFVRGLGLGRRMWLGATDEGHEGTWIWVDGTTMDYRNFARGLPDNAGGREHYLTLREPTGNWNDRSIDDRAVAGYICEWPAPATPTPLANHSNNAPAPTRRNLEPQGDSPFGVPLPGLELAPNPDGTPRGFYAPFSDSPSTDPGTPVEPPR